MFRSLGWVKIEQFILNICNSPSSFPVLSDEIMILPLVFQSNFIQRYRLKYSMIDAASDRSLVYYKQLSSFALHYHFHLLTADKRKKREIAALVDYSWFHHNRAKRSNDEEVWCTWKCTTDVEPATSAPATGIVMFEVTW